MLANIMSIVNRNFNKSEVIKKYLRLWFPLMHPNRFLDNLCMARFSRFSGLIIKHLPSPLVKSGIEKVWNTLPKELDKTCMHKFRTSEDVNQYIFILWNIMEGNAEQAGSMKNTRFKEITDSSYQTIINLINNTSLQFLCINDSRNINNFDFIKSQIIQAFERRFPHKSSFEK